MIDNVDYYSGKTSINRVAYGLKILANLSCFDRNLDYGGGKYEAGTKFLAEHRITNYVYDPNNRTPEHNAAVLGKAPYPTVTMLNVLNVIHGKTDRVAAIRHAHSLMLRHPDAMMIIGVYEGNKSGYGTVTKAKTFQRNRRVRDYIPEIEEAIGIVPMQFVKNLIIIRNGTI